MRTTVFSLFLAMSLLSHAQGSLKDSVIAMSNIEIHLGVQSPAGDMAERFGTNSMLGGAYRYKTASNWLISAEGQFLFGNNVKDNVAESIMTSNGFVIDRLGGFTNLLVQERGFIGNLTLGKLIPALGPNPNSGFVIQAGVGLMQHKIRLETRNNDVPQLEGEYLKGYDRLSNGLNIHQFIGYRYYSNRRLVNFSLGIEGNQAMTENRRDYNFDLQEEEGTRNDAVYGVRFSWIFPIYKRTSSGYYY